MRRGEQRPPQLFIITDRGFPFTVRTAAGSMAHDSHAGETAARAKSFFLMQNSAQYRTFADECTRLAKLAKTEHERKVLEEMAAAWHMLAQEADRKGSRFGS